MLPSGRRARLRLTAGVGSIVALSAAAGMVGGGTATAPRSSDRLGFDPLASPAPVSAAGLTTSFASTSTVSTTSSSGARRGYGNLDDRQARRRTRESFSGFVDSKGWADLRDQPRLRVRRYVGEQAAVVDLAGRRTLVRSMLPLRSGEGDEKKPVDTSLSLQDGRLRPEQPLAEYSIAPSTTDGSLIDFPNSGVKVALAGGDTREARGAKVGQRY